MTDDVVARLREVGEEWEALGDEDNSALVKDAAGEIERLRAALREIAYSRPVGPLQNKLAERYEKIASAALTVEAFNDAAP